MPLSPIPSILQTSTYENLVLQALGEIAVGSTINYNPPILDTALFRHLVLNALQYIANNPGGGGGSGTVTRIIGGTGLSGGTITTSGTLAVIYGALVNTACQGDDSRLSNSRTPSGTAGGDLAGTYPDPTVAKLQGRSVSNSAPSDGQVLQWNGTDWVPGAIPSGGSGGGGLIYFLNYQNTTGISPTTGLPTSPVAPSQFGRTYSVGSGSITSADLSDTAYSRICGFVTVAGEPNVTDIPAGLWDFNIWADVLGGTGSANQTQFQIRIYKYNSTTGVYGTPIAQSDDVYVYDPSTTAQYIANVTMPQTTILATDRIYVEIWAKKNVNQTRQIRFYFDSTHPSHGHTTIPSVSGSGIVKVVNGVFQTPASLIVNSDVSSTAAIAISKLSQATARILGRTTAGAGAVEEISIGTGLSLSAGTLTATPAGTLPVANGGTGRTVGNYSIYANEIHVGKDGNDTTGDGTLINPVLTITKALTLVGSGRNTVIVHPGGYSESPTVTSANTTIATSELTGANTELTGTLTLSAAARVSGLKMANLTITGSGNTYISNCTVDTRVIKSGSNYLEIINSELQCTAGVQITGAGTVSIVGNKCWAVAVSNAAANVLIKDCFQVITPSVTAGRLQFDGCAIFAAAPTTNAVIANAGTNITLANSFVLNSAGTSVERVSLLGSYSILNLVYDKTNSTLTGTNLNAIDYFSVINAETLNLTNDLAISEGGTGASTAAAALTNLTAAGTSTANTFSQPQIITGTSSSAMLRVTQEGSGEALRIEDSPTPDATPFVISSAGKVGVGVAPDATVGLSVDSNGIKFSNGSIQTVAAAGIPTDVQIFSTAGAFTWNKPANAKSVNIQLFGAGGGGGGGRKDSTFPVVTAQVGGAGGGGGGYLNISVSASALANSENGIIGAGGTAGAGKTVTGSGDPGGAGDNTTFNSFTCLGGLGGGAGTTVSATAGAGILNSNSGGASSPTVAGNPGNPIGVTSLTAFGGVGAGAGGSITAAGVALGGGNGGRSNVLGLAGGGGGANTGGAGGAGANNANASAGLFAVGSGGGGGGAGLGVSGGAGGAGGFPAGGGGGGGGTSTGTTSGAGGVGGGGLAIITTYF